MRVYQLSKGGAGIDALAMVERLEPWPAYRQVLVKIESCSLNVRDERVKALPAINGVVPINLLLDIDARRDTVEYDVDHSNDYHQHHHHTIHGEVLSVSFSGNIELDYDKFDRFVQSLPYSVYRAKGTVAIKGLNRRVIFHRVGARNILDQGAPWDGEQRNCRAVLLGKDFDGDKLLTLLRDCAVPRGAGSRDEVSEIFDELMESSPLTIDCEFREAVEQ